MYAEDGEIELNMWTKEILQNTLRKHLSIHQVLPLIIELSGLIFHCPTDRDYIAILTIFVICLTTGVE